MAHRSLIGGTAYSITGGKSMVSGTSYSIAGGRTLIGGTGYDISFNPKTYAMLYSDGYMVFQRGNEVAEGKTLSNSWTGFEDTVYGSYSSVPWYSEITSVKNVSFVGEIVPKSLAYWFYNARNLISVDYSGLDLDAVTNMAYAYNRCYNLTGSPVCGEKVTSMVSAYYGCRNLTGSPVCGNNVTNMVRTYYGCSNLTGSPVCGNNVKNMYSTYEGCSNLTGSPVCGNNVTNMANTYNNCRNLTGSPVCGEKVTNMAYAYNNCCNLTGSPACGNNVTDMYGTYEGCSNLTGSPVCGNNVTSMAYAYYGCRNLTGTAVCGSNVTNMYNTYYGCSNLTGSPVCGNNVTNMYHTYHGCRNLTGSPVCGNNVTNMGNTYSNCSNLTGSPVCGSNVTSMRFTYHNCHNLTGSPVCGNNVTDMYSTYYYCSNLTGSPVCGSNVTSMCRTYYYCSNLTGSPVCGNNVKDMSFAYYGCRNLTGTAVCGSNVTNMYNTYYGCRNITNIVIYALTPPSIYGTSTFHGISETVPIYVYANVLSTYRSATNWSAYASRLRAIEGIFVDTPDDRIYLFNNTESFALSYLNEIEGDSALLVTVESSNDSIVSVSDVTTDGTNVCFDTTTYETEGEATITIEIGCGGVWYSTSFDVKVFEEKPVSSYSVEAVDGAIYGFTLNDSGYYVSGNKGIDNSCAICKVNIYSDGVHNLYLDCISSGENNYDYGLLSNVDTTLSLSSSADSSSLLFKNFKGLASTSVQTVDYGVLSEGEHFIYVKFIKDTSASSGNDSLQFQVRFA